MINVVLCIGELGTEEYMKHTCVVIQSILSNTQEDVHFCIAIMQGEIVKSELYNEIKRVAKDNCELLIVEMPLPVNEIPAFKVFSKYTAVRLFLPKYLTGKWIYMDCADVVVNLDIKELWGQDVFTIRGVQDVAMKDLRRKPNAFFDSFHVNFDKYYNAGVVLMNMDNLKNLPDQVRDERFYEFQFCDQDILNCLYPCDDLLPDKFNFMPICHIGENYDDKKIFHYTAYSKPYTMNHGYGYSELYWMYRFEAFYDFEDCCRGLLEMSYYKNIAKNLRPHELKYIMKESWNRLNGKIKNKDVNVSDVLKMVK